MAGSVTREALAARMGLSSLLVNRSPILVASIAPARIGPKAVFLISGPDGYLPSTPPPAAWSIPEAPLYLLPPTKIHVIGR